jgi:hypothetical protein
MPGSCVLTAYEWAQLAVVLLLAVLGVLWDVLWTRWFGEA